MQNTFSKSMIYLTMGQKNEGCYFRQVCTLYAGGIAVGASTRKFSEKLHLNTPFILMYFFLYSFKSYRAVPVLRGNPVYKFEQKEHEKKIIKN